MGTCLILDRNSKVARKFASCVERNFTLLRD
ncbi:hypothetical protein ACS0PU_013047 [Formica fusca]